MSDKKTAEQVAKTIPCQCSDCGMRESEAAQMIQTYADQELASLREQLERKSQLTEDKVMNTFIEVVEDRHFLEELGPGGNWKVKDGMQEEHSAIEDVKDLIDNLIEQLKQKEDENRELKDLNKELYSWLTIAASHIPEENFEEVKQSISRLSAKLGKL